MSRSAKNFSVEQVSMTLHIDKPLKKKIEDYASGKDIFTYEAVAILVKKGFKYETIEMENEKKEKESE